MPKSIQPVLQLRVDPPAKQRRVTVFFRAVMTWPHSFVLLFVGVAVYFLTFLGWFAAVFTGRNPFQKFTIGYLRWSARVSSYSLLLTDAYPPFSLDEKSDYPVEAFLVGGTLGRVSVLFRAILALPVNFLVTFVYFGLIVINVLAWFITLIRGKLPQPFHNASHATLRFTLRLQAYSLLVQNPYPRGLFGDTSRSLKRTEVSQIEDPSLNPTDINPETEVHVGDAAEAAMSSISVETITQDELSSATDVEVDPWAIESVDESLDGRWELTLTKGGRRTLILQLVIGVILYSAWIAIYLTLIIGSLGNDVLGHTWSAKYRGDITSFNQVVTSTQSDFAASSANWSAISTDCLSIASAFSTLEHVPQYPYLAPDRTLIAGVNNIAFADKTCTSSVLPNENAAGLPAVASKFLLGSQQLNKFLSEIPTAG
jgi:hypothetical protein